MSKLRPEAKTEEVRGGKVLAYIGEHGKSKIIVVCPFCKEQVTCFVWSLAGKGKRCTCRALLTSSIRNGNSVSVSKEVE